MKAAAVGGRLPPAVLPGAGGSTVPLRRGSGPAVVLVRVHAADCRGCLDYLESLEDGLPEAIGAWGGRVAAVTPEAEGPDGPRPIGRSRVVRTAADPRGVVPPLPSGGAGVLVADRYGEVFHVEDAGDGHALPGPRELEEWLRFLATQCPE